VKLVAYFSASGITARAANKLADKVKGDLYEIKPAVPYTDADLDWHDSKSRSSVEMADKQSRPDIAGDNLELAPYDTIYLGFPIWWYVAPTIINTFLEKYDFSGKKVILFATSGSSGFGKTLENLQGSVSATAKMVEGRVIRDQSDIFAVAAI